MNIFEFRKIMLRRWRRKRKSNNQRIDKNNLKIKVILSFKEYLEIFLPYKNDPRLYLPYSKDRLVLCRFNDIGHYEINNVYVDTVSNNSRNGSDEISKEKSRKILKEKYPNGTFFNKKHSEEAKEKIKKKYKETKHQNGEKNSQYDTCFITNINLKKSIRIKNSELQKYLDNGWIKGRIINFYKYKNKPIDKNGITTQATKEKYNSLYNIFKNGNYKSIGDFCKSEHYNKTKVALIKAWKKYVPNFIDKVAKGKSFSSLDA